jgi:hypothetical protein
MGHCEGPVVLGGRWSCIVVRPVYSVGYIIAARNDEHRENPTMEQMRGCPT